VGNVGLKTYKIRSDEGNKTFTVRRMHLRTVRRDFPADKFTVLSIIPAVKGK
jgi:hypothetical protein